MLREESPVGGPKSISGESLNTREVPTGLWSDAKKPSTCIEKSGSTLSTCSISNEGQEREKVFARGSVHRGRCHTQTRHKQRRCGDGSSIAHVVHPTSTEDRVTSADALVAPPSLTPVVRRHASTDSHVMGTAHKDPSVPGVCGTSPNGGSALCSVTRSRGKRCPTSPRHGAFREQFN